MQALSISAVTDKRFLVNSYLITASNYAFLIDPVMNEDLKKALSGVLLDFVIITHEHYDHICSVNEFKEMYRTPVICGKEAKVGLSDPTINLSRYTDYLSSVIPFCKGIVEASDYSCDCDDVFYDGQEIKWQGHDLFIKETPGHSAGSISVLMDDKYLFSGDILFKDYPTATRLPGGSTKAFKTITEPWLDSLNGNVMVYPGHLEPFLLCERYRKSH